MTNDTAFNPNRIMWQGLVAHVAERDGITVEEAQTNLGNLFTSPEVQAEISQHIANSPEAKLAQAQALAAQLNELLSQ